MLCSKSLLENRLEERINADSEAKAQGNSSSDTVAQRAEGETPTSKKEDGGKEVKKLQKKLREERSCESHKILRQHGWHIPR